MLVVGIGRDAVLYSVRMDRLSKEKHESRWLFIRTRRKFVRTVKGSYPSPNLEKFDVNFNYFDLVRVYANTAAFGTEVTLTHSISMMKIHVPHARWVTSRVRVPC